MRKRKQYDDDDGKVIANMNVEGMPWYVDRGSGESRPESDSEPIPLTKEERRAYMRGTMSAAFLVTGIFALVFAAVIIFLVFAWK